MLKMTKIGLDLIWDIDMYLLLKKEREAVFLTLLKYTVKQIINISNHMMLIKRVNSLCI